MRFCIVVLVSAWCLTLSGATLTNIFVMHRHGARTSMGVVDGTSTCAPPYCQLTDNGKQMCLNVGEFVQKQYGDLINMSYYNVSFVNSRSTAVPRVVISGEAFVMGLYNDSLPFVDYVPLSDDVQLSMWTSWPAWMIHQPYQSTQVDLTPWVQANINASLLTFIGKYFNMSQTCDATPMECVILAQDVIASNITQNGPDSIPAELLNNWEQLRVAVAYFNTHILGYDQTIDYQNQIGSLGYPLAVNILSTFQQVDQPLLRVSHVAAHDWTLFALYSALGYWTPEQAKNPLFVPRFAETIILEKHEIATQVYVKAFWGFPQQTAPFAMAGVTEIGLRCLPLAGTGNAYLSNETANGCLIDDLWRQINSTAPASPDGICYATHEDLDSQNCLSNDAPPRTSRCYFYRDKCPAAACANVDGAIANPATGFSCVTAQNDRGAPFVLATIVALVAPTLLGGAVVGFYGAKRIRRACKRNSPS